MPKRRLFGGRLTAFVDAHRLPWEAAMAVLALAYAGLGAWDDDFGGRLPAVTLLVLGGVLLAEFAARCLDAPKPRRYLRSHWLDLVASVPLVGFLRPLRVLSLLRLAVAARSLEFAESAWGRGHSLGYLLPSVMSVWLGGAYSIWVLERAGGTIHSFADALYWSGITMTTVGYGDIRTLTPGGRVVAGLLALFGVALVGLLSAELTSRWLRAEDATARMATELADIRRELTAVREALQERPPAATAGPAWAAAASLDLPTG